MLRWIDSIFPRRALFQSDHRLLHLFLVGVLGSFGFSIVIPFLSLYLHGTRGVPMSAVGSIFFFAALAGALGQVVGGEMSDRLGRRFVLVSSTLVRAASFLGLALAVTVEAPFLAFALLIAVSAFAGRMFEPPLGAMIADIAEGNRRAEYFGVMRIGGNLGWALGPAVGGFLATLSYASLFLVSAGVILVAAALIAARVQETSPRHTRAAADEAGRTPYRVREFAETLRNRTFLLYCFVSLVLFTVMSQLICTLSVYAVEWAGLTKVELGALYTLNGLMVVFLQLPALRLTSSLRLTTALTLGAAFYGVGYGMMGLGEGFRHLTAAMLVVTMGEIIATPPALNLAANFASESTRGRTMGIFGIFNSFGWSIGPLVGGILLDVMRGQALLLWGTIAGIAALAALGFAWLKRSIDPATDRNLELSPAQAAVA